jgi:hypothetical protein
MRLNPYDNVLVQPSASSSVAILSLTGSSAVNGDSIDTLNTFPADTAMVHVRTEIASGTPTTSTVAWALQESADGSTGWAAANDNTGTAIGGTINVKTVANDAYARVEGLKLNRKRYLRIVLTPTYTGGSSPATLAYAELIGIPGNGQVNAGRAASNT